MKVRQVHLKKDFDLASLNDVATITPNLVIVFGAASFFADMQLGKKLKQIFPKATIIGCSSAGEIINNAEVYDDTLVVTGASIDKGTFYLATSKIEKVTDSHRAGKDVGAELSRYGIKSLLILSPGLNVNGSDLVEGLSTTIGKDVMVTGGLAGDGGLFQKTYTLFDDQVSSDTVVALGLKGDAVNVTYGCEGGWEPFGLERKVTKAVSNVLYELDGKPALELYKGYLGERVKDLPASGLLYPFAILRDNSSLGLIRTILNVDEKEGSLTFAGDIPQGSTVRLMCAKSKSLINGAEQASQRACAEAQNDSEGLGILISCVGRKLIMGRDIDEEVEAVKSHFGSGAVLTGFYSYGEICAFDQTDRKPCLHNQTMTITRLSEAP